MPTPVQSAADLDPNRSYTYADYRSWQFTELVELIRGKVLRRMSAPTDEHQVIAGNLHGLLFHYLRRQRCQVRIAPYDVRLTTQGPDAANDTITTVVQPDLCVICDPSKIDRRGCIGAPDWIIEVLSPGSFTRDTRDKFDLYAEAGVGEYWIVAPGEQNIAAYVLDTATSRYGLVAEYSEPGLVPCHTLPDFVLEWTDVFPPRP